jgi:ABC-type uncharacterized transport system permease subunit
MLLALLVTVGLYVFSGLLIWQRQMQGSVLERTPMQQQNCLCLWLWLGSIAALIQGIILSQLLLSETGVRLGFFNAAALIAWCIVVVLLITACKRPVASLLLIVFPIAAIFLSLAIYLPDGKTLIISQPMGLNIHIVTALFSYSVLSVSALQAIVLSVQEHYLRHKKPGRILRRLPPLQSMENLLFQMLTVGIGLLSISLVSGFMFIDNIFAQHLVHKTVLSMIAWCLFIGLLWGRWRYGWRGRTVVRWTLLGIFLLMLSYFGSKLVLEFILQK